MGWTGNGQLGLQFDAEDELGTVTVLLDSAISDVEERRLTVPLFVAHGDRKTSQVVGRPIRELPYIEGAHIACIVRRARAPQGRPHGAAPAEEMEVIMPRPDT